MGGLIVFASICVPYLVLSDRDAQSLAVFGVALGCAALGFADDFIKIVKRRSLGLSARWKLLVQLLLALGLWWVARHEVGLEPTLYFRIGDASIDLGPVLYFVLVFLVIAGTSNGVNLTDGLDGLAAGSCAIVLLAYTAITFVTNEQQNLALLSACLVGACIGFLWFNAFPASIFMGDTGSLGLGGAIGALAVMTQTEVLLIIIGGIFVIEALSVAIQVFAFKTFRRRVLLMAPLHHHFEMMAWSETKIMLRFWIIAAVCSGIGFTLYQQSIGPSSARASRIRPACDATFRPMARFVRTVAGTRSATGAGAGEPGGGMPGPAPKSRGRRCRRARFWSSGWRARGSAAARLLAARGETVRGVDSGHPEGAAGLAGAGVEVVLDTDGLALLEGTRTVVKSPGVPREAPVIAAALRAGDRGGRRARAGLAGDPQPLRRRHRHQRQDDHGRAARPPLPDRRRAGRRRRQRRHAALLAGRRGRARTRRSSARPRASSSRTPSAFAPECAVFLNLAPDHLDRHGDLESYLAAKLRIFANQGNDDVAVYNADDPALRRHRPRRLRPPRRLLPRRRAPTARWRSPRGRSSTTASRCSRVDELGLFGEHNVANAMAAAAAALSMGLDRDAVARGPAQLRRRPAPARAGRRDRRRPLRQRLEGDQRRLGDGRHARLRGRRPRDPRRQREGRGLRAARRAGRASAAPPAT